MSSVNQNIESKKIYLSDLKVRGATWNLYWINFLLFFVLKIWFRPWVREQEGFEFLKIFANSFPNFVEAYLGTFTIASLMLLGKILDYSWFKNLSNRVIYLASTMLAAIFVITQEMKIHNLGGENIYDFNDVVASVIGLIFIFVMLNLYGVKLIKK
ncbi:MAG: hypothetical protein ABJK11_10060 [Balneola sp.]